MSVKHFILALAAAGLLLTPALFAEKTTPAAPSPEAQLLAADTDGNGEVTLDELKAHAVKTAEARFKKLDRNKDGVISEKDRPQPKPEAKPQAQANREKMRAKMKAADTDKDGKVSREEARAGMPKMTDEQFKKMDRNGDGYLCPADRQPKPKN